METTPTPIDALKNFANGNAVECLRGNLVTIGKRSDGQNDYGPWSFQRCELNDGTGIIKVCFKNRDEVPLSMKGAQITIRSARDDKGKPVGVQIEDSEYKGKPRREVMANEKALITKSNASGQSQPPQQGNQQPQGSPPPNTAPPKDTADMKRVRSEVMKTANLYVVCYTAARDYVAPRCGIEDADRIKEIAASLFISGDRAGLGNFAGTKPLGEPRKPISPAPEPESTPDPAPAPNHDRDPSPGGEAADEDTPF